MKLNTSIYYTLLIVGLIACGSSGNDEPQPENETCSVEPTATELTAAAGKASVELTFTGFDQLGKLEVNKRDGNRISTQVIEKSALSERYTFHYQWQDDDSSSLLFDFIAVDSKGALSPLKTVKVDLPQAAATITLSAERVVPDANGQFSVTVSVANAAQLAKLVIESEEIGVNETLTNVGNSYTFSHALTADDCDYCVLRFTATDKQGNTDRKELVVDRRTTLQLSNLTVVSRVTGAEENSIAGFPAVKYTLFNNTHERFNVGGTDLGIVWEIQPDKYGLFFGDTNGSDFIPNKGGGNGGSWRSNVLLFSEDMNLADGLRIDGAAVDANGDAREICYSAKQTDGKGDWTSIPTSAVHANGADYVHYMNIKDWYGWVSNYSSLYRSTDHAATWTRCKDVSFASRSNFGQVGYTKKDGYVYMIGTVTGRSSMPQLARFREADIERQSAYEFWNGSIWVKGNELAAAVLFNDKAGELSVTWHPHFGKWIILYFNESPRYEVTMRTANEITGPWSSPQTVATGTSFRQLYGSFIHPLSLRGTTLYFIMSMWMPYNTYLMSIDLRRK